MAGRDRCGGNGSAGTTRRAILAGGGGLGATVLGHAALAQGSYPSRPVTVVIGYAPGGLTDTMSRLICERMSRELGQPVVVENRTGGATSIASAHVAQARPDGHTLLMGTTSLAINPALQPNLPPREPLRELAPVGTAYESPFLLLVNATLPIRDLGGFLAFARANPGRLELGSSGTGAVNHLLLEMLAREAGVRLEHIPYRGAAPALTDLRAGRIAATFATPLDAVPVAQDGAGRILAVTSRRRLAAMPEVPTVAETLPNVHGTFWQGLFAPSGTPDAVIRRLAAALDTAIRDPDLGRRAADSGLVMQPGGPEAMRQLLQSETEHWSRLISAANIRAE